MDQFKKRRFLLVFFTSLLFILIININTKGIQYASDNAVVNKTNTSSKLAIDELNTIQVKGRAPKTNYTREEFGSGWTVNKGCDTRNIILNRDLSDVLIDDKCSVISGILNDPYTGKIINFKRGSETSNFVQIDHVVPLSDAWQKGAQQFTIEKRILFANDPIELLAVSAESNMQKSDGDAATWLPSNKQFRCQYISRQIAIKTKYGIWVTQPEKDAMKSILDKCPGQLLPSP